MNLGILLLGLGISTKTLVIIGIVYLVALSFTIYKIAVAEDLYAAKIGKIAFTLLLPFFGVIAIWMIHYFRKPSV